MAMNFVPLRCHSNFSLLRGPLPIDVLLSGLAQRSYHAAALTDSEGMYGAVQFLRQAPNFGVKPIIGLELTTVAGQLLVLAKDQNGYAALCRLSTMRLLDHRYPTTDDLAAFAGGLVVVALDSDRVGDLPEIFGEDFYLGVESFSDLASRKTCQKQLRLAAEKRLKVVATDPVYFLSAKDVIVAQALAAIREGATINWHDPPPHIHPGSFLRHPQEMAARFRFCPRAVETTVEIAEKCVFRLPSGTVSLPHLPGYDDAAKVDLLRSRAMTGLRRRYRQLDDAVLSRLESELAVIARQGLADYFLIVSEIVDFCSVSGIPVVGRGSAASSIVAYALGITEVDPIAQNLYFARFLNEARRDLPDIDLDICWRRRDEVIDFVFRRHGRDRVAMIGAIATFAARGAVRELGKALGIDPAQLSEIATRLPTGELSPQDEAVADCPEDRLPMLDLSAWRTLKWLAQAVDGFPRHPSLHCGGMVLADRPVVEIVPLQLSAKGVPATQYDMHAIAELGLLKIDLLGQRGLSVISDVEHKARRFGVVVDRRRSDPQTFALLRTGRTIGVFQLESPAVRSLLVELQPKSIDDLTLALALVRPGAAESGMKRLFLQRLDGKAPVIYPHPLLEPILAETLGNIVYQEQVLRTAEVVAGFSAAEADCLRKAMTKQRGADAFQSLADHFVQRASARGIDSSTARQIFDLLACFAAFGFCKAHAATYAWLGYRAAYLKAHLPIEYMAAVLNNLAGYYAPFVYANEARRLGARLVVPDVDRPTRECVAEGRSLRLGLSFVKGLSKTTIDRIIQQRAKGRFVSLGDLLCRVRPSVTEAADLIRVGAFDYLGATRPTLLWWLKTSGEQWLRRQTVGDLGLTPLADNRRTVSAADSHNAHADELAPFRFLPDYDLAQRLQAEQEILGISVSCHPVQLAGRAGAVTANEVSRLDGRYVRLVGVVADRKRVRTADGGVMMFLTLEDEHDCCEVVVFPETYRRFADIIFGQQIVDVRGKAQCRGALATVIAHELRPCA